jgi:uncharacterized protein (TIGR04255 family)
VTEQTLGKSPLVEVIIGFRFAQALSPDERVALGIRVESYVQAPGLPHFRVDVLPPKEAGQPPSVSEPTVVAHTADRRDASGPDADSAYRLAVTYSDRDFLLHIVGDYPGWIVVRGTLQEWADAFADVLTTRASTCFVRYLNRIDVPAEGEAAGPINVRRYVNLLPFVPPKMSGGLNGMTVAIDTASGEPSIRTALEVQVTPRMEGGVVITMDIVVERPVDQPGELSDLLLAVEAGHQQQKDIFYGLITNDMRNLCQA